MQLPTMLRSARFQGLSAPRKLTHLWGASLHLAIGMTLVTFGRDRSSLTIRRMGQVPSNLISRPPAIRYGARIARICSIPLLVLVFTGWIPDQYLDFGSKGPWPWGALIGFSLLAVALVGLFRPVVETLRGDIEKSRMINAKTKLR